MLRFKPPLHHLLVVSTRQTLQTCFLLYNMREVRVQCLQVVVRLEGDTSQESQAKVGCRKYPINISCQQCYLLFCPVSLFLLSLKTSQDHQF